MPGFFVGKTSLEVDSGQETLAGFLFELTYQIHL